MYLQYTVTIIPIAISIAAFLYTYYSNTKKYELRYQYRCEVLKWYNETIHVLMRLKHECQHDNFLNEELKNELLAKLSAEIEIGRFYFPNVDKGNGFGNEKPLAYKGYRNLILDFLVYSYRLYSRDNALNYIHHAEILEREFTSILYEIINPIDFLKETKKTTNKTFTKELVFEDFLKQNPEILREYIH